MTKEIIICEKCLYEFKQISEAVKHSESFNHHRFKLNGTKVLLSVG